MSPEEWVEVEENLKNFYSIVELDCDGYKVSLLLERITQFKNGIVVYIDGKMKYDYLANDCEERRRFFRPKHSMLLPKKQQEKMRKIYRTKKEREEFENSMKYTSYSPYWTSFRSLKNHFVKGNKMIKLLKKENT